MNVSDDIIQDMLDGMSLEEALNKRSFAKAAAGLALGATLLGGASQAAAGARYLSPGDPGMGTAAAALKQDKHSGDTNVGERPSRTQDPIAYQVGKSRGKDWAERGVLFKKRGMPTSDMKTIMHPDYGKGETPNVGVKARTEPATQGGVMLPGSPAQDTAHKMHRPGAHDAQPGAAEKLIGSVLGFGIETLKRGQLDLPGMSKRLPKGMRKVGQVIGQGEKSYRQITGPWADRFGLGRQRAKVPAGPPGRPQPRSEGFESRSGSSTVGTGTSGSTGNTGVPGGGSGARASGSVSGAGSSAKPAKAPAKKVKQTVAVEPSTGGSSG